MQSSSSSSSSSSRGAGWWQTSSSLLFWGLGGGERETGRELVKRRMEEAVKYSGVGGWVGGAYRRLRTSA